MLAPLVVAFLAAATPPLSLAAPPLSGRPSFCSQGPILEGKQNVCRAYFQKFTYDSATGVCKEFVFGGCHGSSNLFDTGMLSKGTLVYHILETYQAMLWISSKSII